MRIVDHSPDSMRDAITSARSGLTFDYAEIRSRHGRGIFEGPQDDLESDSDAYVLPGNLQADHPPIDLQRRLRNLRRRSQEWENEQGLNILFLALGFLKWVDEEGVEGLAPLALLSCRLDRASPRDAFTLSQEDDDVTPNYTLGVKLAEFGITMPEPDADLESIANYLESVKAVVKDREDWEVLDDVYLTNFTYQKQAMWRDLQLIKLHGTDNPIVSALGGKPSGEKNQPDPNPNMEALQGDLSGGRMDDVLEVRDQFTILPADYSQVLAIASARSGNNLVIHGPPGTGKSQTIANIISTFLAEGKSALFVSEKTAALDQVKRLLDGKNLGVFCLDMHSERGKKNNVYEQIGEAVNGRNSVRDFVLDYAGLTEQRRQLNQLVRDLHVERKPLERTVFQVQGRYALLQEFPDVNFKIQNIGDLDQFRLNSILDAANRIRLRRSEFSEHSTSRWRILKVGTTSLELSNQIRRDMAVVSTASSDISEVSLQSGSTIGLDPPKTAVDLVYFHDVIKHLASAPGIMQNWLSSERCNALEESVAYQSVAAIARKELIDQIEVYFGSPIPKWDFEQLLASLSLTNDEQIVLDMLFDSRWRRDLVQSVPVTSPFLEQLLESSIRARSAGKDISTYLAVGEPTYWQDHIAQLNIVETIADVAPIPELWVETRGVENVTDALARGVTASDNVLKAEEALMNDYEPGLLDLVDNSMLVRYRTDHQSGFRRFFSSKYRADRNALAAFRKTSRKSTFEEDEATVNKALDLKRVLTEWGSIELELSQKLGPRFLGRNTDWDAVTQDLELVQSLLISTKFEARLISSKLVDSGSPSKARQLLETSRLSDEELVGRMVSPLDSELVDNFTGLPTISMAPTWEILEYSIKVARSAATRIEDATSAAIKSAHKPIEDLDALRVLFESCSRLEELEQEQSAVYHNLESDFGERFVGLNTDWDVVAKDVRWTTELIEKVNPDQLSTQFLAHLKTPQDSGVYTGLADSISEAIRLYRKRLEPIDQRYDIVRSSIGSFETTHFDEIQNWSKELSNDADAAGDWLLYEAAVKDLDNIVAPSTTELIRDDTDDSELVPLIVERRILGAWLDNIYKDEPILGEFAVLEHEDRRGKFKELDELSIQTAENEVRRKVFENYPNLGPTSARSSELGVLQGELSKRRSRWPVRRLFGRIPHLLQAVKPCFMMSPLAVSQMLPYSEDAANTLKFDVVIFDEASQVFPEDAVPAILRANQLILSGDQKQLPPTSYYRTRIADDDNDSSNDDDVDESPMTGRESILDVAVGLRGILFNESRLDVHYRSKDESLIRFSNHYFYDDNLLTFPSPGQTGSWSGVHDVYVPDGRFDAGATRTNRIEADRVVDLVFEHMRTRPLNQSLGVVALSRAQADLIQNLIDQRRIVERDVDIKFDETIDEPFFVKNLENVQGDQRDRIILSIGYGPTVASGQTPNRFGPINQEGGQRRLNVAITRAKWRMDVVHSLRASDIRSEQEGPRLLRRYLEYAEDPLRAFESEVTIDDTAETESPFEEAVYLALIRKGYKVAKQVGVSWYRIDLAILSEDGNRHELGIECDGKQYHSSPAARDRDWQRQQVLEGLGWKIHRVWSTAWIKNPEAELARIETALAEARMRQEPEPDIVPTPSVQPKGPLDDLKEVVIEVPEPEELKLEEYRKAKLPKRESRAELRYETTDELINMINAVAETEGPVHKEVVVDRIRECYDMGNVRGSTRIKVERAIETAIISRVKGDGSFIWSNNNQLKRKPRQPVDGNIEHVPPGELEQIVISTAENISGAPRQDLVVEVSRNMGFSRTGARITDRLNTVMDELLDNQRLVERFGNVRPPD